MTCPNCGYQHTRPCSADTRDDPVAVIRAYRCPTCQYQFNTTEMLTDAAQRQAFQAALWTAVNGAAK